MGLEQSALGERLEIMRGNLKRLDLLPNSRADIGLAERRILQFEAARVPQSREYCVKISCPPLREPLVGILVMPLRGHVGNGHLEIPIYRRGHTSEHRSKMIGTNRKILEAHGPLPAQDAGQRMWDMMGHFPRNKQKGDFCFTQSGDDAVYYLSLSRPLIDGHHEFDRVNLWRGCIQWPLGDSQYYALSAASLAHDINRTFDGLLTVEPVTFVPAQPPLPTMGK